MDLKIHHPTCRCAATGRPIAAGEHFCSALVREGEAVTRIDVAAEAWSGPPANAIAWWRSTMPARNQKGPSLASTDVLLDVLERLDGADDETRLRYLLALYLVRRRVLRISEPQPVPDEAPGTLRLACPRRGTEYLVRGFDPRRESDDDDASLQRRLEELLWAGEAA